MNPSRVVLVTGGSRGIGQGIAERLAKAGLSILPGAVAAGADGLVLLTAGAGGQTGWLNPFVFVRAVRAFFENGGRRCWVVRVAFARS